MLCVIEIGARLQSTWGKIWNRKGVTPIGFHSLLLSLFMIVYLSTGVVNSQTRLVRVGIYQNKPKIFVDESGQPAGIFVELLDEIAAQEGWTLEYAPCEWEACLLALEEGQIDLMPDVAFSTQRDELYDFHDLPVLESYSMIYANPSQSFTDLSQLNGKRVAILEGSIQQAVFNQLMKGYGYAVKETPANSLEEAFTLAMEGSADAAIANHFFGNYYYQDYGLEKTPLVFNIT